MPRAMENATGVRSPGLLQLYGIREIAAGIGILNSRRPAGWMWTRVAGDALDLATLMSAMAKNNSDAERALVASAAVLGVTVMDIICATQLSAAEALEG